MRGLIAFLVLATACTAETYYVRAGGGTATQCNGTANTPYPGSGENRDCAWAHPFWALNSSGAWRIRGGDTLVIESGSYRMGFGAPNTGWCSPEGAYECVLPPLPSGPDPRTFTRVRGAGWNSGCAAAPELWATQRANTVLSLDNTSNAEIACLDITDHSGCVEFHADSSVRCQRDQYPFGDWGLMGLHAQDSRNVILRNLNIHGFAETGVRAGRIADWTVEDVRIAANGLAGWDGDLGGVDSSNSGTLIFRRWKVEWNGCAETWPARQPGSCWAQQSGGYGDGVGTGASSGRWIIEDSEFRNNTSDGLDLLYLETVRGERPSVEIRRTIASGNAGNQIKVSGRSTIVNTVAVGNCMFFLDKPFGSHMGGRMSGDHCRAYGGTVAVFMHRGDAAWVVNSTIVGHGDTLFTIECRTPGGQAPACDGSETVGIQNNVLAGYGDSLGGDEVGLSWDPFNMTRGHVDYNIIQRVKETPCPGGARNVCADPLFVNPDIETFDGRLRAGSPAIDSGLAVGSLNGLIPSGDFIGAPRPAGAGVDRGAFEFGAAQVPVIAALVSAASGQPGLVPGSLMSLYGQRLSSSSAVATSLPLPAQLGDTQVLFGDHAAGLVYAGESQINLLVPALTPGTDTTVSVLRGASRSTPVSLPVTAVAPAIFVVSIGGETRGAITSVTGGIILAGSPATPGSVLIAYATGLGVADPLEGSPGLHSSRVRPRVLVDSREAAVQFAGPNPVFPGLDQINFVLPPETPGGREVQVWLEQSDRRSNVVSLPVR